MIESMYNTYIEIDDQIIIIGDGITQIENIRIEIRACIKDTVNGLIENIRIGIRACIKYTVNGLKETINAIKEIANNITGTVVLCSSDTSFTGPGGKNILIKPFLGPGQINILNETTNLEQRTKLEQKAKEKENKEIIIPIKIAKSSSTQLLRQGQQTGTILYELIDKDSLAIVTLSNPSQGEVARGLFGAPRIRRTGVHLDRLSPFGTYIAPETESWRVNDAWHNGVVCTALRQPGIKFVDESGRDIAYNGNKMLVPYNDRRRVV